MKHTLLLWLLMILISDISAAQDFKSHIYKKVVDTQSWSTRADYAIKYSKI
jgi:hypothetical protein